LVTIEQKLALFSKLLQRSANEEFTEELAKLKKEYELRLQKGKAAVDKEAEEIISKSRKKAETERVELVSRVRVSLKKEYMAVKEKYFSSFLEQIRKEIDNFVLSDKYPDYLVILVKKLEEQEQLSGSLLIYMTGRDIEKYSEAIGQQLSKSGKKVPVFRPVDNQIIGGLIAEAPESSIRLNFSIEALLEDNKAYIMQTLFQAIETGEAYGL